jgi:HEAT repeat protein
VNSLGSLIAERRRAQTGPLDYTALSVDDAAIERTLLAALRDPSPLVRARTVDTLALLKLERRVIDAAAPLLADPNPLVRMLAVDLFANAQGQVFEPVATRLSAADPDPLVKALAEYFRQTWQSATTQPQPSM